MSGASGFGGMVEERTGGAAGPAARGRTPACRSCSESGVREYLPGLSTGVNGGGSARETGGEAASRPVARLGRGGGAVRPLGSTDALVPSDSDRPSSGASGSRSSITSKSGSSRSVDSPETAGRGAVACGRGAGLLLKPAFGTNGAGELRGAGGGGTEGSRGLPVPPLPPSAAAGARVRAGGCGGVALRRSAGGGIAARPGARDLALEGWQPLATEGAGPGDDGSGRGAGGIRSDAFGSCFLSRR